MEPAGITHGRARERRRRIADLEYDLHLALPRDQAAPIAGRIRLGFRLADVDAPLVLDFAPAASNLGTVHVNGVACDVSIENGHIVIATSLLRAGGNTIAIDFTAGSDPLNRREGLAYSLFVPARASETFPCFDQPDLKARWTLSLDLPQDWTAVGNAAEALRERDGERQRIHFARTAPLPTYLAAFAAGTFEVTTVACDGRQMRIFHVPGDARRVASHAEAIAREHARALSWMRDYTTIDYPFGKLDVVLIPSFQFTGMEHPGAIYYDADALLPGESPSPAQDRRRTDVIAHEVAHMWFGNLVTMPWFDDVWLKEVFAAFMASQITATDADDEVDRDLRFFVRHHPAAAALDRSRGAVPIRQPLENLNDAGLLYGPALYHKAPIAMRQLERLIGADRLRVVLQTYLARYAFGSAGWPELAALLADAAPFDVEAWGRSWIEGPGRPTLSARTHDEGADTHLVVEQGDRQGSGRTWPQVVEVACGTASEYQVVEVRLESAGAVGPHLHDEPAWMLPAGLGRAYGKVELDDASLESLAAGGTTLGDPRLRASVVAALWDAMLDGRLAPKRLFEISVEALDSESREPVRHLLFTHVRELFWKWLTDAERAATAASLQLSLRAGLARAGSAREKASWFGALLPVAVTDETVDWLDRLWQHRTTIDGLQLGEVDEAQLAVELAARRPDRGTWILSTQADRCLNDDLRMRLRLLTSALPGDVGRGLDFIRRLGDASARRPEAHVIDALRLLHHPLHADVAVELIAPSLALLPEVRRTGDIFLPQRWIAAILGGHRSRRAAEEVERFVASLPPDGPVALRSLVLSVADPVLRAATHVS